MCLLLGAGMVSLLAACGEDDSPLGAWIETRIYFLLLTVVCFYALRRLRLYWESKGSIPEFSNQKS